MISPLPTSNAQTLPLVLVAHASLIEAKQVANELITAGMRSEAMAMDDAAIEEALSGHYDALITAVASGKDVGKIRLLRDAGYLRPIIGLTVTGFFVEDESCFDALLALPLPGERLIDVLQTKFAAVDAEEKTAKQDEFQNSDLFAQLRHSFLLGLADSMKEIERAFAAEDWENVGHLVHALKGTAASFGFMELAQSSKQIESLLRAGCSPAAQTGLNELRSQTDSLLS